MSRWEQWYPFCLAALVGGMAAVGGADAVAEWPWLPDAIKKLYAALMNVSAIYTGFLANLWFTLHFGTTVRLEKVRNTEVFRTYMGVVRDAFYLGLIAAMISAPMVALEPIPGEGRIATAAVAIWITMIIWSIAALARVGQHYLGLSDRQN